MRSGKVLVLIPLSADCIASLQDTYDTLVSPKSWPEVDVARDGAAIRAVVPNGARGLPAVEMPALPGLERIACYGAGHENVDLAAARQRGVAVTSAPGANSDTVADHALGLMLAVARDIPARDRAVRAGGWDAIRGARPTLTGATLGLLGLGQIGARIARRAAAFDMRVVYHTPKAKPDVPWAYAATPASLAEQSDFLVLACPGGPATRHVVDAGVLAALGRGGFLINVARGSVVDSAALLAALSARTIAGAGLDVWDGEPDFPPALLQSPLVVLTPHMSGRSPEAFRYQNKLLLSNLAAVFTQKPLQALVG